MKVNEIVNEITGKAESSAVQTVEALRKRKGEHPDVTVIEKQWDPVKHDVMDPTKRPNKLVNKPDPDNPEKTNKDYEKVARVALAIQKLIVKRAASFLFGREVVINTSTNDLSAQEEQALDIIKKILSANKEKSLNKELARELFKCTEVAEVWRSYDKQNSKYGFDSDTSLSVAVFSPLKGDKLYPMFDIYGDMIAFSREFFIYEQGKKINGFETYTDEEYVLWQQEGSEWVEVGRIPIKIGKIPIVYACQDEPEWADVQGMIDRLEKLLSNFGDTNDYHGSPKLFFTGHLEGFASKGDSGQILQGDENSKAEYLSWDHAPESVKLEIENLLRMIYSITQTPDISFDSVKDIGAVSGIALKLMFMDAHLKVEDKKEIFDEVLTRRYNILKAYVGVMNPKLKAAANSLDLEPEITPYMITDEQSLVEMLVSATGQKQILSRESAIRILNWNDDVEAEKKAIENEELDGNPL